MPGLAKRSLRDHRVDLVPGQLAALAGLGALRDLDLQHLGVDQVGRGDAEATGGDLLDLGHLLGAVARRVLAALAGIGARAEAVHGDGQGLVRLGRQRAQAHAGRVEARDDLRQRLDRFQRQRRRRPRAGAAGRAAPTAGAGRRGRHSAGRPPASPLRTASCRLAITSGLYMWYSPPCTYLNRPPARSATLSSPGLGGQLALVAVEVGEARAADARRACRGSTASTTSGRQADDLEQLRAAVAGDGGDAHLRQDLQQPLADAAAVAAADLERLGRVVPDEAGAAHVQQGLVGQPRVHRGRAEADQAGELVRIARGGGFHDQVAAAAQAGVDQVRVHRAGGQQRVHRHAVPARVAVGEEHQRGALAHRRGSASSHRRRRAGSRSSLPGRHRSRVTVWPTNGGIGQQLAQLALREHRRVEQDLARVLRRQPRRSCLPGRSAWSATSPAARAAGRWAGW